MTTAIAAIIILGLLILFHELGHFSVAKLVGIKVHEFAVGMGPKVIKFTKGETLYTLRALPIGGYVKLEGEDQKSDDERAFGNKPLLARIAVLVAGATMNFILGFLIFVILLSMSGAIVEPIIGQLTPGMPAAQAGLMPGDRIERLNNKRVYTQTDIVFFINTNQDGPINATIMRDGQRKEIKITPQLNEEYGRYMIGYQAQLAEPTVINIIKYAYYDTISHTKLIFEGLATLLRGQGSAEDIAGPVGIVGAIGGAARAGIQPLMILAAIISINLGIFNLLPIPALDGSRIMFLLIEGIRRKPIDPEKEGMVHMIGLVMLLLLMVFTVFNDVTRLVR